MTRSPFELSWTAKKNIIQYFWAGHEWDLLASSRVSLTDRSPTWQPAEWAIVGKLPPVWSNSSRRLFANYHYLVLGLEHFHHNGCWEKTNAPTYFIVFSFPGQLLDLLSLRDRDVCKVCLCFNIKPGYLDNSDRRRAPIHYFLIHFFLKIKTREIIFDVQFVSCRLKG